MEDLVPVLVETLLRGAAAYFCLWIQGWVFFCVDLNESDAVWPLNINGWEGHFYLLCLPFFYGMVMAFLYSVEFLVRIAGGLRKIWGLVLDGKAPNRGREIFELLFCHSGGPVVLEMEDGSLGSFPLLRVWFRALWLILGRKDVINLPESG